MLILSGSYIQTKEASLGKFSFNVSSWTLIFMTFFLVKLVILLPLPVKLLINCHGTRYIGLGSTVSLVDMCMPFRKHLHTGLQNKGYDNGGTIFCHPPQAPEKSVTLSLPFDEITFSVNKSRLLDLALVKVLVQWYYETIHLTIPVISKEDFHSQLGVLYAPNTESTKSQFLPIFYGVLAIAALSIPSNNEGLRSGRLGSFDRAHLSSLFFECSVESNHISPCTGRHFSVGPKEPGVGRSLSSVIALVLQSYYLASIGYQAEAWISVGQAIRLGQDIGLHVSSIKFTPLLLHH